MAEGRIVERERQASSAWSSSRPSATARTGCCAARSTRSAASGAEGIVLDLRGNGGGLLREAVLVSSIFIEDGLITFTKGRTKPRREFEAEGDAIPDGHPGGGAGGPRQRVGLRDRHRRAARPQARHRGGHAHLRQGRLPGGASRSPTAACSTSPWASTSCPSGENIGKKGVRPTVRAADDPETDRDEALPMALETLAGETPDERPGAGAPGAARLPDGRRAAASAAASWWPSRCSAPRGSRVDAGRRRRLGGRPGAGGRGQARRAGAAAARPARRGPRRGRGADARPRPAALVPAPGRGGGAGRAAADGDDAARRDLRDLRHVHHRPRRRARLRRRRSPPSARTTARSGCGCTSPTCRAYVRPGGAIDTEA